MRFFQRQICFVKMQRRNSFLCILLKLSQSSLAFSPADCPSHSYETCQTPSPRQKLTSKSRSHAKALYPHTKTPHIISRIKEAVVQNLMQIVFMGIDDHIQIRGRINLAHQHILVALNNLLPILKIQTHTHLKHNIILELVDEEQHLRGHWRKAFQKHLCI